MNINLMKDAVMKDASHTENKPSAPTPTREGIGKLVSARTFIVQAIQSVAQAKLLCREAGEDGPAFRLSVRIASLEEENRSLKERLRNIMETEQQENE